LDVAQRESHRQATLQPIDIAQLIRASAAALREKVEAQPGPREWCVKDVALEAWDPDEVARAVGRLTIGDIAHEWVHHDRNHLAEIMANVQAYVWPSKGAAQKFSGAQRVGERRASCLALILRCPSRGWSTLKSAHGWTRSTRDVGEAARGRSYR
jgi:hypothetical protein